MRLYVKTTKRSFSRESLPDLNNLSFSRLSLGSKEMLSQVLLAPRCKVAGQGLPWGFSPKGTLQQSYRPPVFL